MTDDYSSGTNHPSPVGINISKEFFAYSELWHASKILYELAERNIDGYGYLYLSCATTTAFSYEAYLNHVGEEIFPELLWKHLERCPTLEKHKLVCDRLGIPFKNELGKRPMQTVRDLLKLRNKIAHGRSELVLVSEILSTENYEEDFRRPVDPKWIEKLMKGDFVKKAREDVMDVFNLIHEARPEPKELLLHRGYQFGSATLQTDGER